MGPKKVAKKKEKTMAKIEMKIAAAKEATVEAYNQRVKMLELKYCQEVWHNLTVLQKIEIPAKLKPEIVSCMRAKYQFYQTAAGIAQLLYNFMRMSLNPEKWIEKGTGKEKDGYDFPDVAHACCRECRAGPFENYKSFGAHGGMAMLHFMRRFGKFDGTPLDPEMDPFKGQVVFIDTPRFLIPAPMVMEEVTSFLKNYGRHITTLNLTLPVNKDTTQNNEWLIECLSMLPKLKHLKVNGDEEKDKWEQDLEFGEHMELPKSVIKESFEKKFNVTVQDYWSMVGVVMADKLFTFGSINKGYFEISSGDNAIPQVEQSSLETLKLCCLPPIHFNCLIEKYRETVTALHIEPSKDSAEYVDWGALEFPNLKSLYVKLHSRADAQKLGSLHPSLGSLVKVHLDYDWKAKFMGWGELLKIAQQNWGDNLTELKVRLPKATNKKEKRRVREDAANCELIFAKLKTLKIWISGGQEEDTPLDFLKTVKEQLGDELKVSSHICYH